MMEKSHVLAEAFLFVCYLIGGFIYGVTLDNYYYFIISHRCNFTYGFAKYWWHIFKLEYCNVLFSDIIM